MNQQFGMYGIQPPVQMTPEQAAAMQKQQQLFLKQQQQYMQQQQQLQKQMAREEQRNRLRTMNVKSMGAPTVNQATIGARPAGYNTGYPQGPYPAQLPQQQFVQPAFNQPYQQRQFQPHTSQGFGQANFPYSQQPTQTSPYTNSTPFSPGSQSMPPQQIPFSSPNNIAAFSLPNSTPFSQPNTTPFTQPNPVPFSQPSPNSNSFAQPNSTPFSQPNSTPFSQPNNTPFTQPNPAQFSQSSAMAFSQTSPNSTSFTQPNSTSFTQSNSSPFSQTNSSPFSQPSPTSLPQPNSIPFTQSLPNPSPSPLIPLRPSVKPCEATGGMASSSAQAEFISKAEPGMDFLSAPSVTSSAGGVGDVTTFFSPQPASTSNNILGVFDNAPSVTAAPTTDLDEFGDFGTAPAPSMNGGVTPSLAPSLAPSLTPSLLAPLSSSSMMSSPSETSSAVPQQLPSQNSSLPPPISQDVAVPTSTVEEDDDFGDFTAPEAASKPEPAPFPLLTCPPVAPSPSPSLLSSTSLGSAGLAADYIPGTLADENADVIHSVEMFAKPSKPADTSTSRSEFDKLIEKSLSGKATKSDPRALFKPAAKPVIPSMKSDAKESLNAANWASLDLGGVFQAEDEADEFGDFSAPTNVAATGGGLLVEEGLLDLPMNNSAQPVSSSTNDVLSLFGSEPSNAISDIFPSFPATGPTKPPSVDLFSTFPAAEPVKNPPVDIFSSFPVSEPVKDPPRDILSSFAAPVDANPPKTDDLLDGIFSGSTPSKPKTFSESSDLGWSDFTATPAPPQPVAPSIFMPLPTPSPVSPSKIPAVYQQIVDYCDTPSGIIDVSRVYEVMLTEKFKVIQLQPLMGLCNMSERPRAADLIDLIGLVALKQKGFPAPSKSDLNYKKLVLPSINSKVLKSMKKTESDKPTLLSFVEPEQKPKEPTFKPVFNFGTSGTIDFANAPFANSDGSKPAPPEEDDDWGDFGSVDLNVKKNGFDSLFGEPEPVDFLTTPTPTNTTPAPVLPAPSQALSPVSRSTSRKPAPPTNWDEPPPLSEDDDDDWADFAHPGQNWGIDHSEIEEAAIKNTGTKNRWGSVSKVPEVPAPVDRDRIDLEEEEDGTCSRFFKDDEDDDGEQGFVSAVSAGVEKVRKDFDSILATETQEDTPPVVPAMDLKATFAAETPQPSLFDTVLAPPPPTPAVETKPKRDLDRLASLEDTIDDDDSFAPFNMPELTSKTFDAFAPFGDEEPVNKMDRLASFEDKAAEQQQTGDSFNPFADFQDTTEECEDEDFGDFSEFQASEDKSEGTATEEEASKTDSLALKNLPSKDLDGFWNDMVDSLGPKVDKPVESEPAFDFAFPSEPSLEPASVVPKAPVSYDALKAEPSPAADEDRLGAWSKCLSLVLATLITCQTALTGPSGSVLREVVESERGREYLRCVTEVFKVACRISRSGCHEDGVVEIFKEIKHTWTLVSEVVDGLVELPTIREFNIAGSSNEEEWAKNCGICLLDTTSEPEKGVLQYNRVVYHVTCANFWLNSIDDMLPNLNRKLDRPLL